MATRKVQGYQRSLTAISSLGLLSGLLTCNLIAQEKSSPEKLIAPRAPWTTSHVVGSPEPAAPYRIEPAFPKLRFTLPTCVEELPGGQRLVITERGGKIFSFPKSASTTNPDLIVDLREWLPPDLATQNVSLLDAELHPKFSDNHFLFVCYVHPGEGGHTRLSRLTLTAAAAPAKALSQAQRAGNS